MRVRVIPNARRPELAWRDGWVLKVAAKAEGGKANLDVEKTLSDWLGVSVRIVAGKKSRDKTIAAEGLSEEQIEEKFACRGGRAWPNALA